MILVTRRLEVFVLILMPLIVPILFICWWDFIFLVTMLLPDMTVMINGVPGTGLWKASLLDGRGTRPCWRSCGWLPRWMAEEPLWCHPWGINHFWSSLLLALSLLSQKTVPPPDFDSSSPTVQSLCLAILYPFSQEQFTLVTKLLIHSINFLLHLFLISLSDFFAQLLHFTLCPGQHAPTKRSFHFRSKSSKCFLTEQSHLKGKLYCDKGIRLVFHIRQLIYILK